ncbi:MAG: type III-A CRISPR-associated RAMP protein Csm3 [Candidatus Kapabacteria bacterium]|nr:type III-A CRISPR-associated RAMP protein Csm3 [Candidatus Kapabacteria bacterium]
MARFIGNIVLKGQMECLTGLHIGGSKEKMEIGGVDSPVIRDPWTLYPYVPGSSLKGKMRSLLEFALGKVRPTEQNGSFPYCQCGDPQCAVCRVFGSAAENRSVGPTRLIVRDAHPTRETIQMWQGLDTELMYTEYKGENNIDRLTSAANPRFIERVVKGSKFNVEFIYSMFDVGDGVEDVSYFCYVLEALKLVEHSAIGKSGSRGYGQVSFKFADPMLVFAEDYRTGSERFKDASKPHEHEIFAGKFCRRLSDFDDAYLEREIIAKVREYWQA